MIKSYCAQKWIFDYYLLLELMSFLREYVRKCLSEGVITYSFDEYFTGHNFQKIKEMSNKLKGDFDLVKEHMDLAYFSEDYNGKVNGAAWAGLDGKKFNFAVITSDEAPDYVFEALVRDCLDEYFELREKDNNLMLEVHVEDEETEQHLREVCGLSPVRDENKEIVVMGY